MPSLRRAERGAFAWWTPLPDRVIMNRRELLTESWPGDVRGGSMPEDAVVLDPGNGRRFWTSVSHGAVKVESGVADFSVFESCPPPGAPGPAPHVHRSYDEAWFIIEGTVEFLVGDRRERQGPGGFVFVPRGVAHSFANPGTGKARMLVIGSSPAQAMVEEIGQLSESGRLTPEGVTEVYRRFDSALA